MIDRAPPRTSALSKDDLSVARLTELDPRALHAVLKLRCDVFVVEQDCAYPDLDGRDAEPDALHVFALEGDRAVGCLRLLDDGAARRIGRVAVAADRRGSGLAARLVARALELSPPPWVLEAQAHLAAWYERFGFAVAGSEYIEDGIAHVPMRRES